MVSPSAFRARQLRYCLLMGPSPNLPPGSYSPPAARASSPSAGGAGNAQRSRSMTTPQHLRGGLYHHAGKRANSSSLSARTPALFSSSSTRTYTCLPPTTRCRLCREVCLLRAFGVLVLEFLVDALSEWLRSRMRGQATFSRKECQQSGSRRRTLRCSVTRARFRPQPESTPQSSPRQGDTPIGEKAIAFVTRYCL